MNDKNSNGKPLKILHVEDSPLDAEITRERLIDAGLSIQIDWAINEQEFTTFLQGGGYDLVLADYRLPGFDAPAALRLTKSLFPGLPFICVSGAIGEEKAVELLKQGATDYVLKNNLDKLPVAVYRALDEVREREARIQADEALRKSGDQHRTILRTAMDGFWLADTQGRLLEVNETFCRMSGYSEQELLTMHISDLEVAETVDDVAAHIEKIVAQGEDRFETRLRRKDGTIVDVDNSVQFRPVEGGQFVVFLRDISERKLAEEALRASEASLAEAQRITHIGSWETDLSTGKLSWSDEMYRILGFPEASPVYIDIALSVFPPDELTRFREAIASAIRGDAYYDMEYTIIRHDGQARTIHDQGEVSLDEHGTAVRMFGTTQDITDRKQSEEEKRRFYCDTIASVTQGKLNLVTFDEVKKYLDSAEFVLNVTGSDDTTDARHKITKFCLEKGLCEDRLGLFESAIGEAMANAIKHAPRGLVYTGVQGASIWVAIFDAGSGISTLELPSAILRRGFSTKVSMGMGFTIMMEATDNILLCTSSQGTTIVLSIDITESRPALTLDDFPDTWDDITSA